MNDNLLQKNINCDICVIGGGLSGAFCALQAGRLGAKVVLMQDRPMLGGNASSEIRMWVRGARGAFNRETGMISELEERNIYYNPTLNHSVFDAVLYDMVTENENVEVLVNTSCLDAEKVSDKITAVIGWQTTTYTYYKINAKIFIDCSGDSILAPIIGAEFRHGRESKTEFNETLAKDVQDARTMGMSILLAARETDHPVKFTPPAFANVYPSDECFAVKDKGKFMLTRAHNIGTSGDNLWWVELGGEFHSIFDADKTRKELIKCIYGVWDHIKNRGDHGMDNWELDWVGFLPGKRESRRYVGEYIMTEHDVVSGGHFYDEIAFGGWPLDDHNPFGMRKNDESSHPSVYIPVEEPYGIPLRCTYSKNVKNLMFAGRNISVTHVALSSTRVMATCALLGQAVGVASALAVKYDKLPEEIAKDCYKEVQNILLDEGVFLPHVKREVSLLTKQAKINLSDIKREILLNGFERPKTTNGENAITQNIGDELSFTFDEPKRIANLRLCFDPDFERLSISDNNKMRIYAMKLHTGKDFADVRVANTLVKDFKVYADGKEILSVTNNFKRLINLPLNVTAKNVTIKWLATNGCEKVILYSADLLPN